MKIVQLFKIYWPDNSGGIAMTMKNIADGFPEYEHSIVVCQGKRNKKSTHEKYKGIRIHRCRQLFTAASTPFSIRFLYEVKKETQNADIVIYHFPYPMADIAVMLGLCSGKFIIWWHCEIERSKILLPLYRPLIHHTLKKADQIMVSACGNLKNSVLLKPFVDKCTVIPFCVNDEYLLRGRNYAMKKHGHRNCVYILFIGRMVWYKGCSILLEAFAKMNHIKCRLIMVGSGPLEDALKEQAKNLKLNNVLFTGRVSEKKKMEWIEKCDFLVLPSISKSEAFALVQLEAMAFGKPVINTMLPSGVPCVSINGVTGITVEPGNAEHLFEAMEKLAVDEKLRDKYGRNALKMVNQEYTKEIMIQRHSKVFKNLMSQDRER